MSTYNIIYYEIQWVHHITNKFQSVFFFFEKLIIIHFLWFSNIPYVENAYELNFQKKIEIKEIGTIYHISGRDGKLYIFPISRICNTNMS